MECATDFFLESSDVLIPNSLFEDYENMRLQQLLEEQEKEREAFSLFSSDSTSKCRKQRPNTIQPIIPPPRQMTREHYERPLMDVRVDVPLKSLPCQNHFIHGDCPYGQNCHFYHSVNQAAGHLRNADPAHPIVLNYRIQKLSIERNQQKLLSTMKSNTDMLYAELQDRTKENEQLQINLTEVTARLCVAASETLEMKQKNQRARKSSKQQREDGAFFPAFFQIFLRS